MTRERKAATNRAWYVRNRSKKIEYSLQYRATHRDDVNRWARERRKSNYEKETAYARAYKRKYRKLHPEITQKVQARFYSRHPGYQAAWEKAHHPTRLGKRREWYKNNPGKNAEYGAARRTLEQKATLSCVKPEEIAVIYRKAKHKTISTGVQYEVDHIWPIKGNGFTGLHVPWNLRIITKRKNRKKHNKRPIEGR